MGQSGAALEREISAVSRITAAAETQGRAENRPQLPAGNAKPAIGRVIDQ
jgi:hypothetical protein